MTCQDVHDDIELYALGTLLPAEARRVEAHVATCERCRAQLREAEETAARLALAAPSVRAPRGMRSAVMAGLREHPAAVRAEPVPAALPPAPSPRRVHRWGLRSSALAASLIVVPLVGLGAWAMWLQNQVNGLKQESAKNQRHTDVAILMGVPSSIKADFHPVGSGIDATGAVTWNPSRGVCFVVFDRLPKPEPGTAYHLWYVVDGGRRTIDDGELVPDDNGKADVIINTSQWRGTDYEMQLRVHRGPRDDNGQVVLSATIRRQQ